MADDAQRQQLENARKAFESQNYQACEAILQAMPKDDLKAHHNLAIVRLLMKNADVEQTIAALAENPGIPEFSEGEKGARTVTFLYEGHETAYFNRAYLLARSGLVHEAGAILRSLLGMSASISPGVLGRVLCVFQAITRPLASGSRYRQRSDDELVQKVLAENMPRFGQDPALLAMIHVAFADASTIQEAPRGTDAELTVYFNNLGVLTMSDGKMNVASLCFAKAESPAAQCDEILMRQPIVYNAGLCALLRGEYDSALACLLSVQDLMKNSPLFWVRVAEATLGKLQASVRARAVADHERMQDHISEQMRGGRVMPNYEFLLLPGAVLTQGPALDPPPKDSATGAIELLASSAVRNALLLLIPKGHSAASAAEAFPHTLQLIHFALYYWCALEASRKNYSVVASVGYDLLSLHERRPLAPNLHVALLSHMVEALVHLGEPDRAMKVLRRSSLSSLVVGSSEQLDSHQQGRVEALFINLAITHIATGSWNQAASIVDSFLAKIYENRSAKEANSAANTTANSTINSGSGTPPGVMLAYNLLVIFLAIAQGNQEKALDYLSRVSWTL